MNITVTVPAGSSNHGNPHLLCTPPNWYDYLVFHSSNYFAHAATVITTPGQGRKETAFAILCALLFPTSGITRALEAIMRCSRFESDPVKRAARAGALCMVVSAESHHAIFTLPKDRDPSMLAQAERPWWNPSRPRWVPDDAVVHGQYHLPAGYALASVPSNTARQLKSLDQASCKQLTSSYNFPKMLISFIQALWAIITLYRTRGDQIQQFGYAAFGLTVAPYAFMSIVNILGSLFNPEYTALFLLRTPLMSEAESAGGFFTGEVGFQLVGASQRADTRYESRYAGEGIHALAILIGCIPLAVIGALSKFQAGDSSSLQRGFTMTWVVLGIVYGPTLQRVAVNLEVLRTRTGGWTLPVIILMCLTFGTAAIGGMVVVGLMIRDYGVCTLLS